MFKIIIIFKVKVTFYHGLKKIRTFQIPDSAKFNGIATYLLQPGHNTFPKLDRMRIRFGETVYKVKRINYIILLIFGDLFLKVIFTDNLRLKRVVI